MKALLTLIMLLALSSVCFGAEYLYNDILANQGEEIVTIYLLNGSDFNISNYYTVPQIDAMIPNLTYGGIAGNLGNFSANISMYYNMSQTNTTVFSILNNWNLSMYYNMSQTNTTVFSILNNWNLSMYYNMSETNTTINYWLSKMNNYTYVQIASYLNMTDYYNMSQTNTTIHSIIADANASWLSTYNTSYALNANLSTYYNMSETNTTINYLLGKMNNFSMIEIVANIGNWSADKVSYYTSVQVDAKIAANGNWSADKASYVPYVGATTTLNLGAQHLETTGNITVDYLAATRDVIALDDGWYGDELVVADNASIGTKLYAGGNITTNGYFVLNNSYKYCLNGNDCTNYIQNNGTHTIIV